MTAAKAQKHDSGDTQYELKISKMWYMILLRNDGNDPSVFNIFLYSKTCLRKFPAEVRMM